MTAAPNAHPAKQLDLATLRALQQVLLERVRAVRRQLPEAALDETQTDPLLFELMTDQSTLMGIFGERGSGKTTLLLGACLELISEDNDIVLPVMRPELFGENDSVLSTFLTSIWEYLLRQATAGADPAYTAWVNQALILVSDTARSEASAHMSSAALVQGTQGPYDFAEDAIAASRSGYSLWPRLVRLVRHLAVVQNAKPRQIVVPIDDADLAPASITKTLRDLRVLASVPGVLPIACVCPADLEVPSVVGATAPSPAELAAATIRRRRELEKVFPYRYRFEITPLGAGDKALFVPISRQGGPTLRQLLKAFRNPVEALGSSIWPIDAWFKERNEMHGLPNPLPSNARSIVQCWETVDEAVKATSKRPEEVDIALRRLIGLVAEKLEDEGGLAVDRFCNIEGAMTDFPGVRPLVTLNNSRLNLFISADGPFRTKVASTREVPNQLLRRAGGRSNSVAVDDFDLRPIASVHLSFGDAGGGDRIRASQHAVASLLAVQELALGSGLYELQGLADKITADEWRFLQQIRLAGLDTDNLFITLPDCSTLSATTRATKGWNELSTLCRAGHSFQQLMVRAMEISVALSYDDQSPATDRHYQTTSVHPNRTYGEVYDEALRRYRDLTGKNGATALDFRSWFEYLLPFQWHDGLLDHETLHHVADLHLDVLTDAATSAEFTTPMTVLDVRLGRILDSIVEQSDGEQHSWVAGYLTAASRLGSEQVQALGSLYDPWRRRVASLQAGAAIAGDMVSGASASRFAPYETAEGERLLQAALEALRRQRARARVPLRAHS